MSDQTDNKHGDPVITAGSPHDEFTVRQVLTRRYPVREPRPGIAISGYHVHGGSRHGTTLIVDDVAEAQRLGVELLYAADTFARRAFAEAQRIGREVE